MDNNAARIAYQADRKKVGGKYKVGENLRPKLRPLDSENTKKAQ